MRHRAKQQLAKQHAFRAKILSVLCIARDLRIEVRSLVVLANQFVPGAVDSLCGLGEVSRFLVIFFVIGELIIVVVIVSQATTSAYFPLRASTLSESCRNPGSGRDFPTRRVPVAGVWDWGLFSKIRLRS